MAGYTIKLIDTAGHIQQKVTEAFAKKLDKKVRSTIFLIKREIERKTAWFFRNDPHSVYQNLLHGELRGHMGIRASEAETRLDAIIDTIIENIQVKYVPIRPNYPTLTGGIDVGVLLSSFEDVLSLDSGYMYITTGKGESFKIDWLRWMLTEGTAPLVLDWEFMNTGPHTGSGRGNRGHMVPSSNSWSVPDYAAGTINDNWLTRALSDQADAYISEIGRIIANNISRL